MKKVLTLCLPLIVLATSAMAQNWGYSQVSGALLGPIDVQIGDINGDSYPDLVTSSKDSGTLRWWQNDGNSQFVQNQIVTSQPGMARLSLADMDEDGDLDVAYALASNSGNNDRVGFFENLNGDGSTWDDHIITNDAHGNLGSPWSIAVWDFDHDGDLDAAVGGDQIGWFRNPGDGSDFWIRTDVDFNNFSQVGIAIGDLNQDNRIDVISARGNGIAWWNDLSIGHVGTNWQHFAVGNNYMNVRAIDVGDMDLDGDVDIITCGDVGIGSTVTVFDNFGGFGTSWDRMDVSWGFYAVQDINVFDIDGDGDLDIYGAAYGDDEISWWENLGSHNFQKHVVTILFNGASGTAVGNLDADADPELVGVAYLGGRLGFWDMNGAMYNLQLTMTPEADPLQIPPGGTFHYDIYFTGTTQTNLLAEYWIYVNLQNGREYNLSKETFTYVQGYEYDLTNLHQTVNGAPYGTYEYVVGVDVANEYTSDSFFFDVVPPAPDGLTGQAWGIPDFEWQGKPKAEVADANVTGQLPDEFTLSAAYPNPFNPSTTIRVALPEAAYLTVRAYNVVGQQVAELASGRYDAGVQQFSFNASGLATGLYFIRATVPGAFNAVEKVVLVR